MKITSKDKCKQMSNGVSSGLHGGGSKFLYNFITKDIKEFNKTILFFSCTIFLMCIGIISYKIDNSYALFSDSITGNKTIGLEVKLPKAADDLISKVGTSGLEKVTHEADSTLQIGDTENLTEYRYRGSNTTVTNNYVYFNCDDINNQTADTCELYRIIGVFPVEDGEGNIENRIKLMEISGNYYSVWDDKDENYSSYCDDEKVFNGSTGNNNDNNYMKKLILDKEDTNVIKIVETTNNPNNWAAPAVVNTWLNTTFYNSINESYQNLIGNSKYYLGDGRSYENERKISGSDYFYPGNPNSWVGKIALKYPSDFSYAAEDRTTANLEKNNWMSKGYEWLLSHSSDAGLGDYVYCVDTGTSSPLVSFHSCAYFNVFPVFYLTANVEFNDVGDGSSTNPYQLANLE